MASQDLNMVAKEWLEKNTQLVPFGGEQRYAISARLLWEWLGCPYGVFRNWWREVKSRQKLVQGIDFDLRTEKHAKSDREKGRPESNYVLTPQAAMRVAASEPNEKGRALLRALVDIVDRIERGDPDLAAIIIDRIKDPEELVRITNRGVKNAYDQLRRSGMSHEEAMAWVGVRLDGMVARMCITGTAKTHGVKGPGYGQFTNAIYYGYKGKNAAGLREELGLKDSDTPRNGMGIVDLAALNLIEAKAAQEIERRNVQGNNNVARLCGETAAKIRKALDN